MEVVSTTDEAGHNDECHNGHPKRVDLQPQAKYDTVWRTPPGEQLAPLILIVPPQSARMTKAKTVPCQNRFLFFICLLSKGLFPNHR